MQEKINEKISLMVDDQLDKQQTIALLKNLREDPALQTKLQRYHLISQAIKGEQCLLSKHDFADKIHQQLRQEPTYFMPRKKAHVDWQKAGLAVAASVVLAVFWTAGKIDKPINSYVGANTLALQNASQAEQSNARFKEYLQAHDNAWYVNNSVNQPYVRLAGYRK